HPPEPEPLGQAARVSRVPAEALPAATAGRVGKRPMRTARARDGAARRWRRLWRALGSAAAPMAALDALLAAYAERHRAYHDFAHIRACLRELDRVAASAAHPEEVEVALWFHDAVYDPRRGDNEERSAAWAVRTLREQEIGEAVVRRIRDMIRATRD